MRIASSMRLRRSSIIPPEHSHESLVVPFRLNGVTLEQVGVVSDGAGLSQALDFSFGYDGFLGDGKVLAELSFELVEVFGDSDQAGGGLVEVAFELWGDPLLRHAACS
jgi:hypothetical protein